MRVLRVWVDDRVRGLFGLGKVLGFFFFLLFFFFQSHPLSVNNHVLLNLCSGPQSTVVREPQK